MKNNIFIISILLFFYSEISLQSYDWCTWRGPNGDGISKETKWNPKALDNQQILWNKKLGAGWSSVSIQNKKLYTMGNINNIDIVYCLNAETGEEIWKHNTPCKAGNFPGPRGTPSIDGEFLYTGNRFAGIYCLNKNTGEKIWETQLDVSLPYFGSVSTPLITETMVIYNAGKHGVAVDKKTGKVIWSTKGTGSYAVPVLFNNEVAIFSGKGLFVVDAETGKLNWDKPWKTRGGTNIAAPIIHNDKIFITTGYNAGCALLDIRTGKEIWKNKVLGNQLAAPILINGYLYGIHGMTVEKYREIVCMEFSTGKEIWREKTDFATISAIGNKLFILTELGQISIISATPDGYNLLSSTTLKNEIKIKSKRKSKQPVYWTPPIFCNAKLYCRNSHGLLTCINMNP